MTDSIGDQGAGGLTGEHPGALPDDHPPGNEDGGPGRSTEGPDPAVGAGITLLGIFMMGMGGARDAHYVFDVGVLTAVLGAGTFVLFVALSAMKQRRADVS